MSPCSTRASRGRAVLRPVVVGLLLTVVAVLAPVAPRPAEAIAPVAVDRVLLPPASQDPSFAEAGWAAAAPVDTRPFAMVGLEVTGEAEVQVRTALGDGAWSEWVDVPHLHDEGPDPSSPEARDAAPGHRTHPVFTGPADRLQVRSAGTVVATPAAWLIDPFGLDRSWAERAGDALRTAWHGTPPATATAAAGQPDIVTRAGWGADEAIVRNPPTFAESVERAFVHHTVGSNSYSQAQAPGVVRGIQAYHVNGNGWSDIGYNFLVDRFGTIYEGRAGGIDQAVIGAQAGGFNTYSTGVSLMGTFTSASPGAAAMEAVARVVAWKADIHHFHPLGQGIAVSAGSSRYPEGAEVLLQNVSGHRDVSLTSCPGEVTYGQLTALRGAVRERAGDIIVDQTSDVRSTRVVRGDPDAEAITFTAGLDPEGPWVLQVRDPGGRVLHTEQGQGTTVTSTLHLVGDGWPLGRYTWDVSAPGRTAAQGELRFDPPTIRNLHASTALATAGAGGVLNSPVAVHADLWSAASWRLTITDPAGATVHEVSGQGDALDTAWFAGVTAAGTYRLTVTAEDAAPVSMDLPVRYDLFERLGAAEDPVGGAVLLSGATFDAGSADRAVIARHDVFADALAGGPLASTDGPLLLTPPDRLDDRVVTELDRVLADGAVVYVLGGPAAVGPEVMQQLVARYGSVVRVAGTSRVATAVAVAALVVAESGTSTAMVARAGPDDVAPWADALAGGAYGAAAGVPVLLSDTDRLSPETAAAISALGITDSVVLGGTAALSSAVEAELPRPVRVAGDDRVGTALAVADRLWPSTAGDGSGERQVVVANGYDADAWAWALAAAPLAARQRAPLVVTTATTLPDSLGSWLAGSDVAAGVVAGPSRLVSPEVAYAASDRLR